LPFYKVYRGLRGAADPLKSLPLPNAPQWKKTKNIPTKNPPKIIAEILLTKAFPL